MFKHSTTYISNCIHNGNITHDKHSSYTRNKHVIGININMHINIHIHIHIHKNININIHTTYT